jgi:predicted DNA-binding transcriptional regulator YafY
MKTTRVKRLLDLLRILQADTYNNPDWLAASCEVSRRTIFRDLEILRGAGVPVKFDSKRNRYYLPADYFLPPANLSPKEALALMVWTGAASPEVDLPLLSAAQRAALKVEAQLPSSTRMQLSALSKVVTVQHCGSVRVADDISDALIAAIEGQRAVQIEYDDLTCDRPVKLKLYPYQVMSRSRLWYVVGRSSLHRKVRVFNLQRIASVDILHEKFRSPPAFSLDAFLGNAWNLVPSDAPDTQVVVRFESLVALNVTSARWHKTQEFKWRTDGRVDFHVTISGLSEIVWWILGFGDQAEVIRPARLRRLVSNIAARMQLKSSV